MLSLLPGGRRIKKYIYRMIGGIVLSPAGPLLLVWNEIMEARGTDVFQSGHPDLTHWGFRLGGFLLLFFCCYRIFSAAKLFMSKIPLTYNEIRNGILFSSFLVSITLSLVVISICRIFYQPMISLVLAGVAMALIFALLIRGKQKKSIRKQELPSVVPHRTKDT